MRDEVVKVLAPVNADLTTEMATEFAFEFDKCQAERCARVILHWFPQLLVEQMTANIASFLLGNYEP